MRTQTSDDLTKMSQACEFIFLRELLNDCEAFKNRIDSLSEDQPSWQGRATLMAVLSETVLDVECNARAIEMFADGLLDAVRAVRQGPDGFVYVLKAGDYYKVGKTRRLEDRIKTLKIQLPFAVSVAYAFPCLDHSAAERALHEVFDCVRVNGEWFQLETHHLNWLDSIRYAAGFQGDDSAVGWSDSVPAMLGVSSAWGAAFDAVDEAVGRVDQVS